MKTGPANEYARGLFLDRPLTRAPKLPLSEPSRHLRPRIPTAHSLGEVQRGPNRPGLEHGGVGVEV